MSRYGINFYGPGTYYGEIPLIEFDARPMSAQSQDYGTMLIKWHAPAGAWDTLRLTRDNQGFVPRYDMGTLLLEIPKTSGATEYRETGLETGRFYYYTVWVRATIDGQWRRAGDVIGLATKDWGYSGRLFDLLPGIYREKDSDTQQLDGQGQLERYLGIIGFEADHIRTEFETLKWVNDPAKVSGGLLSLMADQLGFGFENELGMRLARQQMKNAVHIYKRKGTQLGIEALVSVLTGWAPTVTVGYNLILDQNDSAAAEGTGHWAGTTNCTLGRRSTTDTSGPGAIAGPVPPPGGASTGDTGSGLWMRTMIATGAGDMVSQSFTPGTNANNQQYGIPVTAALSYTYSLYTRGLTQARSVKLGLQWFDKTGASLGAVTESGAVSNATGSWTRHTYTVTSPANAAFALLQTRVLAAGGASEVTLSAAGQFEQNATARAYQGARSVRIRFAADRVNLMKNASFEIDTSNWTQGANTTAVRSTTQFYTGAASLRLTATAGGDVSATTTTGTGGMPVTPGRFYATSGYLFKPSGTARQFRLDIIWYTAAGATISTSTGTAVTQTVNTWTRASIVAAAPATAAFAAVTATVLALGAAEQQYVDAFLFEASSVVLSYFDATNTTSEGEYMYNDPIGAPGIGPHHYYARRTVKNYRVNARLPEFLPAGASYALLYAAQA